MGVEVGLAMGRRKAEIPTIAGFTGYRAQQGFSTVAALTLIPLLLGAFLSAATLAYAFQRKLTAQSLCLSHGVRLQASLKNSLEKLTGLNPRAGKLRVKRLKAEAALTKAVASGIPPAIAAAKAQRTAVILQQLALRSQQQLLLQEARLARLSIVRELNQENRVRKMGRPWSQAVHAGLAVLPAPASSLTPDYRPAPNFEEAQKQSFEFQVLLTPDFFKSFKSSQSTKCTVTLEGKEKQWSIKILVGSLWSKPQSSSPFL